MGGMAEDLDDGGVLRAVREVDWAADPSLLIIWRHEVVAEAVVNQAGSDGGSSGWDLFTSVAGLPAARRILDPGA
jgi:hypothetical protein